MFKLDVPPQTGPFTEKWGTLWIGTCNWGLSVGFMYTWEISSCTTFSSTSAIAPSSPTASVLLFFVEAGLIVEKRTGECSASQGQTTGDSCCHQFGMSLTDECTALDKPLHGCIESDLLQLVRGTLVHRLTTVVKNVHLLATVFGQVTPSSPRCWSQQSRISAPNSSCGQTSTARHESCCRNGQPRRWSAPASEELAIGSFRQL